MSTCTEWSITRSAGQTGFIFCGSPPRRSTASRIAAKSTTAGTPLQNNPTVKNIVLYGIVANTISQAIS